MTSILAALGMCDGFLNTEGSELIFMGRDFNKPGLKVLVFLFKHFYEIIDMIF